MQPGKDYSDFWEKVRLGQAKMKCQFGPHHGVAEGDDCARCTADYVDMMTMRPDRGPWTCSDDGKYLESDDFRHDVSISITGDFWDDRVRHEYAQNICDRLNATVNLKDIEDDHY